MRQVNIHEAKTHFSKLVDAAERGETTILAKAGRPIAKIVPLNEFAVQPPAENAEAPTDVDDILNSPHIDRRRFGFMKGKIKVPDDFDTMYQDEIIAMFEGRE
jgi:prevent-host-death family protein